MKPETPTERAARIIESLNNALAGRADHAPWCGLTTKLVYDGLRIGWQDSFQHQAGILAIVPQQDGYLELLTAVVEFMADWKAAAAADRESPVRKERKSADRARCVRQLGPDPHRRALARRTAAE